MASSIPDKMKAAALDTFGGPGVLGIKSISVPACGDDEILIRVAVAPAPDQAIPLQGSWIGFASDHLVMNVAVKVAVSNGTLPPRFP